MSRDTHEPDAAAILDASVIDQAASWFVRLSSGVVSIEERTSFEHWRTTDARNALAWSRFEMLQQTFQHATLTTPATVANSTLRTTRRRLGERRQLLKGIVAIAAAVPLTQWLRHTGPLQQALADYRSGVGERRQFTLADGTRLWLNTDSAVDVHFDARERRLLLRGGEIQIATAPDARPLIVSTSDGSLRPIGTRFTVRRYSDETQTRLQVSEGIVEVRSRDGNEVQRVVAGQMLNFDTAQLAPPQAAGSADDAWIDGMLGAERMRLDDFIAELSRHRPGVLRCDPAVADLRLTGTFPLADTDRVLAKLAETLPVNVQYRSRYWVSVTAR